MRLLSSSEMPTPSAHPLCEKNGLAQTALDILLFLHNNPGRDTAKDICTYRHLKPRSFPVR